MIRPCETAVQGFVDATLRLVPPVFATEEYVAGYIEGIRWRIHEARKQLETLRAEGAGRCEESSK